MKNKKILDIVLYVLFYAILIFLTIPIARVTFGISYGKYYSMIPEILIFVIHIILIGLLSASLFIEKFKKKKYKIFICIIVYLIVLSVIPVKGPGSITAADPYGKTMEIHKGKIINMYKFLMYNVM